MSGIRVIKALSKEDYEKNRFNKVNKEVMDYELQSSKVMATLNPTINFILKPLFNVQYKLKSFIFLFQILYSTYGHHTNFINTIQ